jgi:primosomal protein N' (replication factor Y)
MTIYLEIAVSVPHVSGVFHYHLPPNLENKISVGCLVSVPFGSQIVQGVVLRHVEQPEVPDTKSVLELVDPSAVLTRHQLRLAKWLSYNYLAPLSTCVHLMLPPGLVQHADNLYSLCKPNQVNKEEPTHTASGSTLMREKLISLLKRRGPLRGAQIDAALPHLDWRPSARSMVNEGILTSQSILPRPRVHPKHARTVQLSLPPAEIEKQMVSVGKPDSPSFHRRQAMLRVLLRERNGIDVSWLYAESGGTAQDLSVLEELGFVSLGETEVLRDPLANIEYIPEQPPELTRDQTKVFEVVQSYLRKSASGEIVPAVLLHGVTGSGKTEIYLRLVQETIQLGRHAFILVPEIALTPQTIRRFVNRFPGQVGIVHSALSTGERYDTWRRAREGLLPIIIGPRSALFSPLPAPGLIVVDECHDDSYYQSDPLPYYHARETAITYAELCNAFCLLGSATPNVVTYAQATNVNFDERNLSFSNTGKIIYLQLPNRIIAHHEAVRNQMERLSIEHPSESHYQQIDKQAEAIDLPKVHVVDMRGELKSGNRSIFSLDLQKALDDVLKLEQQAILFLNRRGTSTYVFCRDCGYILKCPRCELPLVSHHISETDLSREQSLMQGNVASHAILFCHHCLYERGMPRLCPQCGSTHIRQFGTGTQRVEAEVLNLFPQARTLRWDWETTRHKGAHEVILSHFSSRRANILIGTQMLAKGLDLPFITLVGVVLADIGLGLPDFTAGERTFQVLTQVAGRAGRSPLGGQVILQTFQPDHYVIRTSAMHDFAAFAKLELDYRWRMSYPPFSRLVRLEYRHTNKQQAEQTTRMMASKLQDWLDNDERKLTHMIGPVPPFFSRLGGIYRWQIILRGPDPVTLLRQEGRLREFREWHIEVDPPSLL